MPEFATFSTVVDELWKVANVLKFQPVDELIAVTSELATRVPDDGWLEGLITPRRLERDTRMLTALRDFQQQLRAIDAGPEEA